MKIASIGGTILVILALIITFLKQIIAFVGFLTLAIKILLVVVFVALLLGVGLLAFRTLTSRNKVQE